MKQLSNEELCATSGGGLGLWAAAAATVGVFAIGVVSGYVRPNKCK